MATILKTHNTLIWLYNSIHFFKNHFLIITGLRLIAAFGRSVQLGAFGQVSSVANIILEIIVEFARILIFLYVLGLSSLKKGLLRIEGLFTKKNNLRLNWNIAVRNMKTQWFPIAINITAFSIIALGINYVINFITYKTNLFLKLQTGGIISKSTSEWVLLLFFKNITVIPFTLIFCTIFFLWITNKFKIHKYQ